jgi:hypothetical protein
MSLDHEPLGDMGARGPVQDRVSLRWHNEESRAALSPENCAMGGVAIQVQCHGRLSVRAVSPRADHSPRVNAAAEPISSPA